MTKASRNPGNFANDRKRASMAGRRGGSISPGNFKFNPKRASEAGKLGGSRRKTPA
ncbi:MAG TPA: general stress protein [Candidatus Saccharimonadales bacterium]|nr:general stress protein [Candidatus Saccharimonadales bacterium]